MYILEDVREAQMRWDRRFAGRREAPQLNTRRTGRRLHRLLLQIGCVGRRFAVATSSAVANLYHREGDASGVEQHQQPSRECAYPA
jgi:hypothetical protein